MVIGEASQKADGNSGSDKLRKIWKLISLYSCDLSIDDRYYLAMMSPTWEKMDDLCPICEQQVRAFPSGVEFPIGIQSILDRHGTVYICTSCIMMYKLRGFELL